MGRRTNTAKWDEKRKHWKIDVQKDGTRRSFYSSTPGRAGQREANSKADAWLDDGIDPRGERVKNLYTRWYADQRAATGTGNCRNIESRWRVWILPAIGEKRISQITDQDLQEIINSAHAAGRSKKTLQTLCADLRAFCKFCRRCKITTFNPEFLSIPAGARLKGKQVLQPQGLLTLFACDTTFYRKKRVPDPYINAYRFQVLTGLRPGELIGLRWEGVSGRTVRVQRSINVDREETRGKNDNAVRSFYMSDLASKDLQDQRRETGGGDSVFEIIREKTYYARWQAYCKANDIPPISLYELRHTFVSVVKTLPAGEVKGLVGHSEDMDTFGVYGHALSGDDQRTAVSVNAAFLALMQRFAADN